jgi:gliding motility-associated-like protein
MKRLICFALISMCGGIYDTSVWSQDFDNAVMKTNEFNFQNFASPQKSEIHPAWYRLNSTNFQKHSEFGSLPYNAPCKNCVEDLSKRTLVERYFVDIHDPGKFYIQKAIGLLHQNINGQLVTINDRLTPKSYGLYEANQQLEPVGINAIQKFSYITTPSGEIHFNNWTLTGIRGSEKIQIAEANWSNHSIGSDGMYVTEIFPGIDAQLIVLRGSIKTNFIVKEYRFQSFDHLVFSDRFASNTGQNLKLALTGEEALVSLFNQHVATVGQAVAYPDNDEKDNEVFLPYTIESNVLSISVPVQWLKSELANAHVIIDPLVQGTGTLAQASITGSMYNASCNFTNSCDYNLTVAAPANATFTDVRWSFNYITSGSCRLNDGALKFSLGSCISPAAATFFWFCNSNTSGTCNGANISIFSDLSSCLPAPSCSPQNVVFTMRFFRRCVGTTGCNNACVGANSPWTMVVEGRTIEYTATTNQITVSSTTVCAGQSITASTTAQFGVPTYSYNWSFSASGTPSVGTGSSASITFPTPGTVTLYSIVTDACGNQITVSRNITVTAAPVVTANPNPVTICSGQATGIGLTSSMSNTSYSWTVVQSGVTGASNGSGTGGGGGTSPFTLNQTLTNSGSVPGTATYTITPTSGGCPGQPITVVVTVNPRPVATATPTSQTICSGQTTSIALSSNVSGTTFSWTASASGASGQSAGSGNTIAQTLTATGTSAGTVTYTVTPSANGCTGTPINITITINPIPVVTATPVSQTICSGQTTSISLSSNITGTTFNWTATSTGATGHSNGSGNSIAQTLTNTGTTAETTTYTVTPSSNGCQGTPLNVTITVNPQITPTFNPVGPFCSGASIPALPTTSNNGISGTWSPAINNTNTTTYTFSPSTGQCATTTTITITINTTITPTFTPVGPFCEGSAIPALPTTSDNGIAGSWSPAINNTTTTTYTFTPSAGSCGTSTTMTITITNAVAPTFTQLGPFCTGETFSLPTTSTNGISGTWSPAVNNTTTTGYTFTPNAGQCATTATMTVTINPQVLPTFTQLGPYCQNLTPGSLPTTSNNGISGTWNPVTISTATVGSQTYTFTPTAGQCASTSTMTVSVDAQPTPTFTQLGPYCQNSTPGSLPATSNNGISGTWNPATISTSTVGSQTYTFTPNAGQCATTTTMTVDITTQITPNFSALGPYCQNSTPGSLPATSMNGISGTWSPSTITTTTAGNQTYTFTPTVGQCATVSTLTITVDPQIQPNFAQLGPFCQGTSFTLPVTSTNGVSGTWSPAINTNQTTTYNFTPTAGQCATNATMTVIVNTLTTPTFTQLGPYCQNAAPGTLPTTSNNGIQGVWNPATVSTAATGNQTYTFTPNAGQCADVVVMTVSVTPGSVPNINSVNPLCVNSPITLLTASTAGGTWSGTGVSAAGEFNPATAGVGTHTISYTTPPPCGGTSSIDIVVNPAPSPSFSANTLSGCVPLTVEFTNNTTTAGTCSWNFGDGSSVLSGNCNPNHSFTTAGCFNITLQYTSPEGCTATAFMPNYICTTAPPVADFTFNPVPITLTNTTVSFTNESSSNANSFDWSFGNGLGSSNETNASFTFPNTQPGSYEVCLTAQVSPGCQNTTCKTIVINDEFRIYVPNAFSPNGDGMNDIFLPVVSGYEMESFRMYVYNRWGEVVFETSLSDVGWDGTYKNFPAKQDVYVWRIQLKDAVSGEKKQFHGHVTLISAQE